MGSEEDAFAGRLCRWQRTHGRNGLPWQVRDPYRRWLSEIMLQQTRVAVVQEYFPRFLARFPTVQDLAAAEIDEVTPLWAGLGYYARCHHLHAAARMVAREFGGEFPRTVEGLCRLPGVGRSTAGAIAAACWDVRAPILDGNAKRVLARHFCVGGRLQDAAVARRLWALAEREVPAKEPGRYAQALMDLGSEVCVRTPRCGQCPVAATCLARARGLEREIPARAARRAKPWREVTMAALVEGKACWVVKRAARGIWPGLWCLPEFAGDLSGEDLARECGRLGVRAGAWRPLASEAHELTHCSLTIRPWVGEALSGSLAGGRLVPIADAAGEALPAPVVRILSRV